MSSVSHLCSRVAITMGDAAGIGPEIILRSHSELLQIFPEVLVFGSSAVLRAASEALQAAGVENLPNIVDVELSHLPPRRTDALRCVDCGTGDWDLPALSPYPWGKPIAAFGALQWHALISAIRAVEARHVDAIVTAPWHKARLADAGLRPTGHTEVLEQQCGADRVVMLLCGDVLRVALATTHIPLRDVPAAINADDLLHTVRVLDQSLREDFGLNNPHIAICGLNPHAGENGVIGSEDRDVIAPVIARLLEEGKSVSGPWPADTIFPRVVHGAFHADAVLAMYHDQGLGPLKTAHFGHAANVTLGLPLVRTSVDHGTAYDIAGRGVAETSSLIYATRVAAEIVSNRHRLGSA